MVTKVTWLFNYVSGKFRVGGFSETWYSPDSPQTAMGKAKDLSKQRAAFLPQGAGIVGIRVQELGKRGFAETFNAPGGYGTDTKDIPQVATLCIIKKAGIESYKRFFLRAVPDAIVHLGDYTPTDVYTSLVNQWVGALISKGFTFSGIDPALPKVKILGISDVGVFTFAGNVVTAVNDEIQLLNCTNTFNENVSGTYRVSVFVNGASGTFLNWNKGTVNQKGEARKSASATTALEQGSFKILRIGTRKIGRPFDLYRGRASVR